MKTDELHVWLKEQRPKLDELIAISARSFHTSEKAHHVNFGHDLAQSQLESFNLIDNKDLCYDRFNTPLVYSLWYHARRVNTFLSYFTDNILKSTETEIEIFDLGAGTGAIQWAIGLVYHRMREAGLRPPKIRIVNIDTSPFMLYYSRDYLWKHFVEAYPYAKEIDIDYEINSWSNNTRTRIANAWIIASYLFDVSDTYDGQTNQDYRSSVKSSFLELIKSFDPSAIFLLTSYQNEKKQLLGELRTEFAKLGYSFQIIPQAALILTGNLDQVNAFRDELHQQYNEDMQLLGSTRYSQSLTRRTSWDENRFIASVLTKQQTGIGFTTALEREQQIKLFNEPIKVRTDVELNDDQKKAAEHSDRPTVILGPAGCGKSIVLTERVANLVREADFAPTLKILVTTFNKDLLGSLGNWIEQLLAKIDKTKFARVGDNFHFQGNLQPNIKLLHFDVLPTRLGNGLSALPIGSKEYHEKLVEDCISQVKRERNITTNIYDKVLSVQYVLDEYHRVIYGLQFSVRENYLKADRKGRPRLQVGGIRRELLWDVIVDKYLAQMKQESFISKRHRFLQQLKRGDVKIKFTHVFLDEFQDCTEADYNIFNYLLEDPNNFVIAGDVAQALQLGSVADVPRLDDENMQRRVFHRLKGSYRLPFRISECIAEISKSIENGNVLSPYKGSPPGSRPIVIYADNDAMAAKKIASLFKVYQKYNINSVSILESDGDLGMALHAEGVPFSNHTILRIKGMERSCVLWSSKMDIEYKYEVEEFVHTIMTRTSGILIIALFPNTLAKYIRVLKMLRGDRLILWDRQTTEKFNEFYNGQAQADDLDETD